MNVHPIAVLGENLVDLLVSRDSTVNAVIGGGPLNVARTISRLGAPAHFISGVSGDAFGALVRYALRESGVRLALDEPRNEPTTLAVVELDPAGPRYHFHLNDTAAFALDASAVALALGRVVHWSAIYVGTLGLLVEPMAYLGESVVTDAARDTLIVIDPNCRPSAVRDDAGYRARVARVCARADVVKVSTEDLDFLYPRLTHDEGVEQILALGARCVILTDGPAPVRARTAGLEVSVAVTPTDVVDTVGAGDALVGGFLTWWTGHDLHRDELDDATTLTAALTAATDIARLTCERAGAQPPWRDEVTPLESWRWL